MAFFSISIDDTVMRRLREEAARRGCTMSELVEAGLRHVLAEGAPEEAAVPELPRWSSGRARVDVADRDHLYELMEGR